MVKGWSLQKHLTGSLSDAILVEWKYFNVCDGDNFCLFTYSVGDPRNVSGVGKGIICASVFNDGDFHSEVIKIPLEQCKLSMNKPDGKFGGSSIKQKDGVIRITGKGEKISWNLLFEGFTERYIVDGFDIPSLLYPYSWLDWILFFCDANVKGFVNIREIGRVDVRGKGYHDGNVGKWIPFIPQWQVFGYESHPDDDVDISVSLMELYNKKNTKGYLRVTVDDSLYRLGKQDYSLQNLSWTSDTKSGIRVPTKIELKANKGDLNLQIVLDMKANDSLKISMSPLLPALIITEQFGPCEIKMKLKGRTIIKNNRGMGVNEYTARKYL